MRAMLAEMLGGERGIDVVGVVADTAETYAFIRSVRPQVVAMDLAHAGPAGLALLDRIVGEAHGLAVHDVATHQTVDAVRHRAAGDEGLLDEGFRTQLERLSGAAQSREAIPLPRLQVAAAEGVAPCAVEVSREPVDPGEHF